MVEFIPARGGTVLYNIELTGDEIEGDRALSVTAGQIGDGRSRMTRCAICGALLGPNSEELEKCPICGTNRAIIRVLESHELAEQHFSADFYLSAMDVPASKVFYGENQRASAGREYFQRMQQLQTLHVCVVNLWCQGQDFWRRAITHRNGNPALNFIATSFNDLGITVNWTLPKPFSGQSESLIRDYEEATFPSSRSRSPMRRPWRI